MVRNAKGMRGLRLKYSASGMQCVKRRAVGVGLLFAKEESIRDPNKDPEGG